MTEAGDPEKPEGPLTAESSLTNKVAALAFAAEMAADPGVEFMAVVAITPSGPRWHITAWSAAQAYPALHAVSHLLATIVNPPPATDGGGLPGNGVA